MSDVPRSFQSWVSTIQTMVLTADVFQLFTHSWRFSTFYKNFEFTQLAKSDVPRSLQSWVPTIQTVVLTADVFQLLIHAACKVELYSKKLKNGSCEYHRLNGWNSTLQAAWYIRHVRIICFLWTKRTIWLIISFTQNIVRACPMFYPYEGYRSVSPLDAANFWKRGISWLLRQDELQYWFLLRVRVLTTVVEIIQFRTCWRLTAEISSKQHIKHYIPTL